MEIKEIEIQSFRSLINQRISFNERCLALIGLNESGKTNILDAIRSLDSKNKFSLRDRSKINQELPSIIFRFTFTDKEKVEIREYIDVTISENSFNDASDIIKDVNIDGFKIRKHYEKKDADYVKYQTLTNDIEIKVTAGYSYIPNPSIIPVEILLPETEIKLNSISIVKTSLIPNEHLDK